MRRILLCALTATVFCGLTVREAVEQNIPLVFSRQTAMQTLREQFDSSLSPPSYLAEHLHALRQLAAQAGGSAAEMGSRGSGSAWALMLGLVSASEGAPPGAPAPLLRTGAPWQGAPRDPLAALLPQLGRALGVDAAQVEGGALPPPVGLLLVDGARCHGALARDLAALAPRATRFLVVAGTEDAGLVSEAVAAGRELGAEAVALGLRGQLEAAAGLKGALFDLLAGGGWRVTAHFPNAGGLTILSRLEK
jgi:hypothetical protein